MSLSLPGNQAEDKWALNDMGTLEARPVAGRNIVTILLV